MGKECQDIQARVHGYLPVVTINHSQEGLNDRVASTIRHNRARGKHKVESMSDIVVDLKRRNWSNKKIGKELGKLLNAIEAMANGVPTPPENDNDSQD